MRKAAPGVRLRVRRIERHYIDDVEQGRVDLAIGVLSTSTRRLEWRPLMKDSMVWVARKGHPFVKKPLTMAMLNRASHVVMDKFADAFSEGYTEMRRFLVETPELRDASGAALDKTSVKSGPAVFVSDALHALAIVRGSDFVTLEPAAGWPRTASTGRAADPRTAPPHPGIELGVIHHSDRTRDPGFAWLLTMFDEMRVGPAKPPNSYSATTISVNGQT